MEKLTRNTITKLPIILKTSITKRFKLHEKLSEKLDSQGTGYTLVYKSKSRDYYNHTEYYVNSENIRLYQEGYITKNDKIKDLNSFDNYPRHIYHFNSAHEAREWLSEHVDLEATKHKNYYWEITGEFDIYSYKKKKTYQEEVAKKWFKRYRILNGYNSDFIWYLIEPGKDYIDLSLFQYSSTTEAVQPYRLNNYATHELTDYILRINNKGKILGIVQISASGKRSLVSTQHYSYGWKNAGSGSLVDAYHVDIERTSSGSSDRFSITTMHNLKSAGFPSIIWYSHYSRWEHCHRLNNLNVLETFTHEVEDSLDTIRSKEICDYLKDIPFDEEHCVVPFKNGYIARFGKVLQAFQHLEHTYNRETGHYEYQTTDASELETCRVDRDPAYNEKPGPDGKSQYELVSPILEERFVEGVRLWISNNFNIRSVCTSTHGGTKWSNSRIDLCDSRYSSESEFAPANPRFMTSETVNVEAFNKKVYEKLFAAHPKLKYLTGYTEKHPSLYRGNDIKFLRSLFKYQNVIETFIKLGKDDIFWNSEGHRYGCGEDLKEYWVFEDFAETMKLKEIPFKAGMNMFQLLGLNKQQFNLIFNNPAISWKDAIYAINGVSWRSLIPDFPEDGWRSNDRHERASYPLIPIEMIKNLLDCTIELLKTEQSYNASRRIADLVRYGLDLKHIYKYVCIKHVDVENYKDYLSMRQQIINWLPQREEEVFKATWDKYLDDATDVQFSHDRMVAYYNIVQAERDRYRSQIEKEKQQERQHKYDKRYKILKEFNYVEDNDDRCIVVPKQLVEVVTEGQVLHHCAGSFVDSLAEGRDTLVFLRNKNTPNTPYVTVAILYDTLKKHWFVDQAHTAHNGDITPEDVCFLKRWGAKNNVLESSITTHYGAKCHH